MRKFQTPNRKLTIVSRLLTGIGICLLLIKEFLITPIANLGSIALLILILAMILLFVNYKHKWKATIKN